MSFSESSESESIDDVPQAPLSSSESIFTMEETKRVMEYLSGGLTLTKAINLVKPPPPKPLRKYLITYTTKPPVLLKRWAQRIIFEMSRKFVDGFSIVIEKLHSNAHAHALVQTHRNLQKRDFETYTRKFGFIDLRFVEHDNGVDAYGDMVPITTLDDLEFFFDKNLL